MDRRYGRVPPLRLQVQEALQVSPRCGGVIKSGTWE